MGTVYVDKLDPQSGTALEIGSSGDTITVPTGAGLTVTDEVKTNKISPSSGTAFTLGDSGDTFTVPSGATITNSGTATGFGIAEVDNWRISATQSISADTGTVVNSSWERNDTNSDKIGTGLSESSGVFTFPSTGIYLISYQQNIARSGDSRYFTGSIMLSTNSGVAYSIVARSYTNITQVASSQTSAGLCTSCTIDVTDASTFRLRFETDGDEAYDLRADSTYQITGFYCIKLGDT
jgi:hypothetical protein